MPEPTRVRSIAFMALIVIFLAVVALTPTAVRWFAGQARIVVPRSRSTSSAGLGTAPIARIPSVSGLAFLSHLQPPIDAAVVAVKQDLGIAVLSVGSDDGVQEGFTFVVYRGPRFVGKVQVTRLMKDMAGVKIVYLCEPIRVGDSAFTDCSATPSRIIEHRH